MTTLEDLLYRGEPHGAEFTSAGLWCPLSFSLEHVAHGSGWVVLWFDLKLSMGYVFSEPSQEMQVKVSHCLCPGLGHPT